jgi:hypothetical protein
VCFCTKNERNNTVRWIDWKKSGLRQNNKLIKNTSTTSINKKIHRKNKNGIKHKMSKRKNSPRDTCSDEDPDILKYTGCEMSDENIFKFLVKTSSERESDGEIKSTTTLSESVK